MKNTTKKMKVTEWLADIDGHTAIDAAKASADYEEKTGRTWPAWLKGRPVAELLAEGRRNYKGLQVWNGDASAHVLGGWQVAAGICRELVPSFESISFGRGSAFREYLDALRKAGF